MLDNSPLLILYAVIKCAADIYNPANQGAGIINIKSISNPITFPAAITINPYIVSSFTSILDTLLIKNGKSNTAPIKKQKEKAIIPATLPPKKI